MQLVNDVRIYGRKFVQVRATDRRHARWVAYSQVQRKRGRNPACVRKWVDRGSWTNQSDFWKANSNGRWRQSIKLPRLATSSRFQTACERRRLCASASAASAGS